MSESEYIPPPDGLREVKPAGPNAYRYKGTGSHNNQQYLGYAEPEMNALKADFIEVLAHGYTVDRAVRLLGHWATSPQQHKGLDNVVKDEPHPTYGRAVPSRKTFYMWARDDKEFQEAWDEAFNVRGTEHIEDFALDLGYAGDSKMIQFILKARNPGKYANFGSLAGTGFQITITPGDENL